MITNRCCFNQSDTRKACWVIESNCNANCSFCFYKDSPGPSVHDFDCTQVTAELARNGIQHVVISGGEPLLSPRLLDVLWTLRSYGLSVGLCTNAILASDSLCNDLYSAGLRKVTVNASLIRTRALGRALQGRRSSPPLEGMMNLMRAGFEVTANDILSDAVTPSGLTAKVLGLYELGVRNFTFTIPICTSCASVEVAPLPTAEIMKRLEGLEPDRPDLSMSLYAPECDSTSCPSGVNVFGVTSSGTVSGCVVQQSRREAIYDFASPVVFQPDVVCSDPCDFSR